MTPSWTRAAALVTAGGALIVTAACAGNDSRAGDSRTAAPSTRSTATAASTKAASTSAKGTDTPTGASPTAQGRSSATGSATTKAGRHTHDKTSGKHHKSTSKRGHDPSTTPSPGRRSGRDPITGGKKSDKPVLAVKIDNVAAARPQAGIGAADIVVAERVESDLTRLVGVFHSSFPKRVGPVRSARNTDLQLLGMFNKPGLVFSGANSKVMKQVKKAPVHPIKRSRRDHSRKAPHNVIVNLARIARTEKTGKPRPIGYRFAARGGGWKSATGKKKVKIAVGDDTFGFAYRGGTYRTSWNGHATTDAGSHKPVRTDNIVRLRVKSHKDTHTTSNLSTVAESTGSGVATIYSHGKKRTGRWSRSKRSAPMILHDGHGKNIDLKPGRTWIVLDG